MSYTLAQMRAYTRAAERSDRRRQRDTLVALRAAQYDRNTFKALLKKLDDV